MIEVKNAHKELGQFSLRGVDLRIESGEYFVVLGPTGAGKTVLLEAIAGLHLLDEGEVWVEGRNVTGLAPELRNIGYVPQDYVLFPHISLRDNIEFALTVKKAPREHIDERVNTLSNMLGIAHLLERRPRTLSGGEQQRGALARALAPAPTVLLLDEPLSALDEGTRAELIDELNEISEQTGTTVIHVCHNFEEALELADRIAIMREGLVVQVGSPADVFRRPVDEFVARFVGAQNLYPVGAVDRHTSTITLGSGIVLNVADVPEAPELLASIRPEEISITRTDGHASGGEPLNGDSVNHTACTVTRVDDRGRFVRLRLTGGLDLTATLTRQAFKMTGASEGAQVVASFDAASVHLLPPSPDVPRR